MKNLSHYWTDGGFLARSKPGFGRRVCLFVSGAVLMLAVAGFLAIHYPLESAVVGLLGASLAAMNRS